MMLDEPFYLVYSKNGCSKCEEAIQLLKDAGKKVIIKKLDEDPNSKKDIGKMFPQATVIPQIFVVHEHLDGLEELKECLQEDQDMDSFDLEKNLW